MWYKFTAYNSQTLYGWTQVPEVAEAYLDVLNRRRDINAYQMTALSDRDDEDDGRGRPLLKDRTDHVFDDDTTPEDIRNA